MVSLRRLRAVLQLAIVSAIAWGIVAILINMWVVWRNGWELTLSSISGPFLVFAFFGLLAGTVYAVALGFTRLPTQQGELSLPHTGLIGAFGGALMWLGVRFLIMGEQASGLFSHLWLPGILFGILGGMTGIAIQSIARRASLPPAGSAPRAIEQ